MRRRLKGLTTKAKSPNEKTTTLEERLSGHGAQVAPPEPPDAVISDTDEVPDTAELIAPEGDALLVAAIDLARAVAVEVAEGSVGDYLGVEVDDELVVTHAFATTDKAYLGWRWTVTVARAEGSDDVTVDEVVLLPGAGSLLAPAWVPWAERIQSGDLSPGDLLPAVKDDPRLVPAYTETEDELAAETFWELGLGRSRVLSLDGRLDAADRWYFGEQGPDTAMARQAPGTCFDCAFRIPLAGGLKSLFAVCANAFANDDGKVVSLDHGCGAHSEAAVETPGPVSGMVVEDEELEMVTVGPSPEDETPDGHAS